MAARDLTISVFELVGNLTIPSIDVKISLVDGQNNRIQAIVTATGQAILDEVEVTVSEGNPQTLPLYPQEELTPVVGERLNVDPGMSHYLVELKNDATQFFHRFRSQVATGGPLSWAEFVAGSIEPIPGDLPAWMTHLSDQLVHVPPGGTVGQALGKLSNADHDVDWITGAGSGDGDMLSAVYDPQTITADAFDAGNQTGSFDGGVF